MSAEVQEFHAMDDSARRDAKRKRSVITTFRTEQAAFHQRRKSAVDFPRLDSADSMSLGAQPHVAPQTVISTPNVPKSAFHYNRFQGKQVNKIKVVPVDVNQSLKSPESKKAKSPKAKPQTKRSSLIEKARSIRRLEEKVSFITRRRLFFKRMRQLILYVFGFVLLVGIGLYSVFTSELITQALAAGQVTTIVQNVRASAMAMDANGTLYIADAFANRIYTWNGTLNDFAGSTIYAEVDGPVASARFSFPTGLAIDVDRNIVYVASRDNQAVRSIQNGTVSTKFSARNRRMEQPASLPIYVFDEEVDYYVPISVAVDSVGNLFIGSGAMVEKIDLDGTVTVIAGNGWRGYADGHAASARFRYVRSLVVDPTGRFVYLADMYNRAIRRIDMEMNEVTTLTPRGFALASTARQADCVQFEQDQCYLFDKPYGIALGANGSQLVVADSWNNSVTVFDINGTLLREYGTGDFGAQDDFVPADPTLRPQAPTFGNPMSVAVDADGFIYVGDAGNRLIRLIAP
ncbi:hypothetical protein H310_00182 [Aphanomyces invadans]|nr:hypothetical protein H310_00182 [Aphanomyces invadans]ETW09667.1 hypothetical protein H310_00182 [Aphanomyces invadans]|eukprot:XP_008861078.1 hypothetical protein H310_00182 [Aphanomyces invadans]